jgi:hypothetical protein
MKNLRQEVCLQSLDNADLWNLLASRRGGRDCEIRDALIEITFSAAERKWPKETFLQLCEDAAESSYFSLSVPTWLSPSQFQEAWLKHLEDKKAFRTKEAKEAYDREIKRLSQLVRRVKKLSRRVN